MLQICCKKIAKKSCKEVADRFNKKLHKMLQRNVKVAKKVCQTIAKKGAKIHSPLDI